MVVTAALLRLFHPDAIARIKAVMEDETCL